MVNRQFGRSVKFDLVCRKIAECKLGCCFVPVESVSPAFDEQVFLMKDVGTLRFKTEISGHRLGHINEHLSRINCRQRDGIKRRARYRL